MGKPLTDEDGLRIARLEQELARIQSVALEVNAPLSYTVANLTFALEEVAAASHELANPVGTEPTACLARAAVALKVVAEALDGARNGADRAGRLLRSLARGPTSPPTAKRERGQGGSEPPTGEQEAGAGDLQTVAAPRPRVLVVDDEPMMVRAIQRLLEGDLDVVSTTDPANVVARVQRGERFDVILCDLMMPTMSGIEVYEAIRLIDDLQARRVVFMTGGAFTAHVCQFLDATENARIEKPVERASLLTIVRSLLSS